MSGFIAGSVIQGYGAKKAADKQAEAADRATAEQRRQFERQMELQEPFRQAGANALPELIEASRYTPFDMEQFQQDPGYAFRMREGLKALDRTAAARGGLLSGAQLRGVTRYGQELGSQEYTNAFNRYQAERAARLNPLQSLVGMGQTNAATMAQQAGQAGQNIGANIIQGGVARASGYAGMANAATSGLSSYLAYQQNQARNQLDREYINALTRNQPAGNTGGTRTQTPWGGMTGG